MALQPLQKRANHPVATTTTTPAPDPRFTRPAASGFNCFLGAKSQTALVQRLERKALE